MVDILQKGLEKVVSRINSNSILNAGFYYYILSKVALICSDYRVGEIYKKFDNFVDNIYRFAIDDVMDRFKHLRFNSVYVNEARNFSDSVSDIFQRALLYRTYSTEISEKTIRNYISDYKRFCTINGFDKLDIRNIDENTLNFYIDDLVLIPSAYKNLKTVLYLIFNYAIDNDIIKENPVDKLLTYDDYYTFITNKKCSENNNFKDNSILGREHKKVMLRIKTKNITELDYLSSCFYLQMDTYEFSEKVKEYNIPMNEKGHYLLSDLNKLKKCA